MLFYLEWHPKCAIHWAGYIAVYQNWYNIYPLQWRHNEHMASQITSIAIVYSIAFSVADQRKHSQFCLLYLAAKQLEWYVCVCNQQSCCRCSGVKIPDHQYTDCWLEICCVWSLSYTDIALTASSIGNQNCNFINEPAVSAVSSRLVICIDLYLLRLLPKCCIRLEKIENDRGTISTPRMQDHQPFKITMPFPETYFETIMIEVNLH